MRRIWFCCYYGEVTWKTEREREHAIHFYLSLFPFDVFFFAVVEGGWHGWFFLLQDFIFINTFIHSSKYKNMFICLFLRSVPISCSNFSFFHFFVIVFYFANQIRTIQITNQLKVFFLPMMFSPLAMKIRNFSHSLSVQFFDLFNSATKKFLLSIIMYVFSDLKIRTFFFTNDIYIFICKQRYSFLLRCVMLHKWVQCTARM